MSWLKTFIMNAKTLGDMPIKQPPAAPPASPCAQQRPAPPPLLVFTAAQTLIYIIDLWLQQGYGETVWISGVKTVLTPADHKMLRRVRRLISWSAL